MSDYKEYYDTYKEWLDFQDDLIYSNRFFPKLDTLNKIKKLIVKCDDYIDEGEILFRAREYVINFSLNELGLVTKEKMCEKLEKMMLRLLISTVNKEHIWSLYMKEPETISLLKKKEKTSEWGYSKEESGKPNREKAGLNRASPKYISYLYLASDVNTSLAEARAQTKQKFSVAQYKITKPLHIVNFTKFPEISKDKKDLERSFALYNNICQAFSAPSSSNEKDYIMSQYIAEYIKKLGFAGLSFDSSRRDGGINYTLFNDDACEFIKSELYVVKNIEIESERIFPTRKIMQEVKKLHK
jgi:hypothetical protein